MAEERLERPAAGKVDPDAAGGLVDARAELEDADAERFDLRGPQRRRQAEAEQVDEVVREAVQEQTKGIGQEAVATQPVGGKAV